MRVRAVDGPLRCQAVSGTHVVQFGLDFAEAERAGILGFGIERLDHTAGTQRWLPNNLRFRAVVDSPDPEVRRQWGTDFNPLQTFLWGDYTAEPDRNYTYFVHAMAGEPGTRLTPRHTLTFRVRTEQPKDQGVWFNRGAISSQAYADRFGNRHPEDVPGRAAWQWLSRGLEEALLAFIGRAIDETWELHGAFYEFRLPSVLGAFAVAERAGASIRLIVHEDPENRDAATAAGIDGLVTTWRGRVPIPHNKFLVASKDGVPVAVWTGSTNLTPNGVFGQSNVGHSLADRALAAQYLAYWERLRADPKYSELNDWVDAANPLPPEWPVGTTVVFSPHTRLEPLNRYAQLFAGAASLACITFPFNLDSVFGDALPGQHPALRFLLFENPKVADAARATVTDPGTVLASGGFVPQGALAGWAGELRNPLSNNIEYVHTKYLLVDPLGDDPIVVTGSANFSKNSTRQNDENMLVIRGDRAVADIYFTEFMRLFSHYRFRTFLEVAPEEPTPGALAHRDAPVGLATTDAWMSKYFDEPGRARQREALSGAV